MVPAAIVGLPLAHRRRRELLDTIVPFAAILYAVYEFALEPQLRTDLNRATLASIGECALAVMAALLLTVALAGYRNVPASVKVIYASIAVQAVSYPVDAYVVAVQESSTDSWVYVGWQLSGVLAAIGAIVALRSREVPAVTAGSMGRRPMSRSRRS
jgi:hypothetical protein